MHKIIITIFLFTTFLSSSDAQTVEHLSSYKKQGVVWSAGVFKSWLKDEFVRFNKIGNNITPVFLEQKKMGFALQSHYMYKPNKWFGIGGHIGLGLDVFSSIDSPVLLIGGSVSFGKNHQFIFDFGLADGKKKIIRDDIKAALMNTTYDDIPIIHDQTQVNTAYYFSISYRIF
ncbi:MAG: hypothetical protein HKO66_00240 [Saprospiraceae bacterium]|nr:hypothetical protein [Bacteroidia bacterium]NNL90634.1 hypothetical protein [Saprospiraceae bacterium]